jgi:lysophospholipase L1-like esterase
MIHSVPSRSSLGYPPDEQFRSAPEQLRLVLVGDSTVCDQPCDSPYRGWGQYLCAARDQDIQLINRAKSGASTKTFREEGLWDEVLNLQPDWVLIQFGHNDSHAPDKPESTRANGDYAANLRRFIAELRAISARPVLVTPVRRFHFGSDGLLSEAEQALAPYAHSMREVGRELQVPVVDLFASSTRFFESIGPEASRRLSPVPGEDYTHFNEAGARAIAELVALDLAVTVPMLQRSLCSGSIKPFAV